MTGKNISITGKKYRTDRNIVDAIGGFQIFSKCEVGTSLREIEKV